MLHTWMDRLGGLASTVCTVHCVAMSLLPALLAGLGLTVLMNEAFEWSFFVMAVVFGLTAAFAGYTAHRAAWVAAAFGLGIVVLVAGRIGEASGAYEGALLAVAGGVILVVSHLANARQLRARSNPVGLNVGAQHDAG